MNERIRPKLHFTVPAGWMNDPHGIVYHGGLWHMFFQFNPKSAKWESPIVWGHATSRDLVDWEFSGTALDALPGESGVWSGSICFDPAGVPMLFYSRPDGADHKLSETIVAIPSGRDLSNWNRIEVSGLETLLLQNFGYLDVRDPQVRRDGAGFKLVIGGGHAELGGVVNQYSSTDLRHWVYDGLLVSRQYDATEILSTGTVWECPQFLQVDGHWVLLVSVFDQSGLRHVRCAIGDYDGKQFTPRRWGAFERSGIAYATTTFTDADGRNCALSWVRETGDAAPAGSAFAGAQSLPVVLSVAGGRLQTTFHPDVENYFGPPTTFAVDNEEWSQDVQSPIRLKISADGNFQIQFSGQNSWRIDCVEGVLSGLGASGETLFRVAVVSRTEIDLVLDSDICEVIVSGVEGLVCCRVPANEDLTLRVSGQLNGTLARSAY